MKCAGSLDANVILRLVVGDVPAHTKVAEKLIVEARGVFMVSELALVEIEYALRKHYGLRRGQVAEMIAGIINHPKVEARQHLIAQALEQYLKYPKLSFVDCCLVATAEMDQGLPLWTFDHKLATQAKELTKLLS